MAKAFEQFAQDFARLTTEANDLTNERREIERKITVLRARHGEITERLTDVEAESIVSPREPHTPCTEPLQDRALMGTANRKKALARSYATPISQTSRDRNTPEDTKPVIEIEDDDGNITLTPRSVRPRAATPPQQNLLPQPVSQPAVRRNPRKLPYSGLSRRCMD